MKKLISLLLAAVLLLSIVPLCGVTAGAETFEDFEYTVLDDGTVEITDYTGSAAELTIPSQIDGKSVTSIGDEAFSNCDNLASITIPKSVTSIGYEAFYFCTSLTGITIPDSVTSIGDDAFMGCTSLESIELPDSVTIIEHGAFFGCTALTSIEIPDSVTSIENQAFVGCTSLTIIELPDSVTSIESDAFENCTSLTIIELPDSVTSIESDAFEGTAYYNDESNWEDDVLYIGNHLIEAKETIEGDYTVKPGTKTIANSAFSGCTGLTGITIPDSVTSIGDNAFSGCENFTDVYYGGTKWQWRNSVDIGWINGNLKSANVHYEKTCPWDDYDYRDLDDGTVQITDYYGAETDIKIPSEIDGKPVTSIVANVFYRCESLASIEIPASVTSIEDRFYFTDLSEIKVSDDNKSYSSLDGVLFNKDKTELIRYPAGKTDASYSIPSGVTSIGDYAFFGCTSLTSIEIPDSVTSIGRHSFEDCTALTSIEIPAGVTSIEYNAFFGCTGLTSVTIPDSVTSIEYNAFSGCTSLTSIEIPDSVTSIEYMVFSGCTSLTSIEIPDSVTSIGSQAFSGCTSLTSIKIPDSVTNIGLASFLDCKSLANITIPDSVTSIGNDAFSNTAYYNDESNWEDDVLYIGNYLIDAKSSTYNYDTHEYENDGIQGAYTIKPGTKTIASGAFRGCTALTSVTIPDSVTSIADDAFYNCTSLASIEIPASVTSIGSGAFEDCTSLASITIPDSVTSIGYGAFSGCTSLANITIPDSVTSIEGDAFYNTAYYNDESNWEDDVLYIGNHLIRAKPSTRNSETYEYNNDGIQGTYTIKQGTKTIAGSAFRNCTGLTSVTIPDSVTGIGDEAFYGCTNFTEINVSADNTAYSSLNGVLFNKGKAELICYPEGKQETSYSIPAGVKIIDYYAFHACLSLTSVEIPASVIEIADWAFYDMSEDFVMRAKAGTAAEAFAKNNGIKFEAVEGGDAGYLNGDANHDSEVNATDATLVLQYFAKIITDETTTVTFDKEVSNVNGDEEINATDATLILQYFAKIITLFPVEK